MPQMFTWIPVHQAISKKLLEYRDRQDELIEILKKAGIHVSPDGTEGGEKIDLKEMEPLSFYGHIYKHGGTQRIKKLNEVANLLGIKQTATNTNGVPSVDARNVCYFPFKEYRDGTEIDTLWDFFEAMSNQTVDDELFRTIMNIKQIGQTKLTQGMFRAFPDQYLPIDSNTKPFLESELGIDPEIETYSEYTHLLELIQNKIEKPFWEVSVEAYLWRNEQDQTTEAPEQNYWWINANPDYWTFSELRPGEDEPCELINENGNARRKEKNFKQVQAGDLMIGYETGDNKVKAILEVTESMEDHGGDAFVFRLNKFTPNQPTLDDLKSHPQLAESTTTNNHQGTLFELTKDEFITIHAMAFKPSTSGLNTILFGPPGTGKTYQLRNRYAPSFTIDQKLKSQEEFELDMIEPLTWWETTGLALLETGETTVPELRTHRFIRTKENISNVKNVNATLWSTLQAHSSPDFDNVNISNRTEPFIFRKLERSVWTVLEEEIDQKLPHLKETLSGIEQYSPESVRQQNFVFTTFHQSFTYEDFVEGIKPVMDEEDSDSESGEIQYAIKKGIFYKAVDDACQLAGFKGLKECLESTPERQKAQFDQAPPYALFIDEINRGNIAAIMGELITLIEDDKRISGNHELIVKLPYSKEQFGVPPNLHIIGTMNTADRSVEALDTALRRRFQFQEVPPDPTLISKFSDQDGIITVAGKDIRLDQLLRTINRRIEKILDKDHLIGHSYFLRVNDWKDLRDIFRQNIIPLLEEYFYGDKGKIQLVLGKGFIEKVEDQSNDLFPETDYDDQDLFAERFVWRIRDEWKTDQSAFADALQQLNIHSSE